MRREAERVSTEQRETVDAAYLLEALCGCVALAALGGIFEPFVRATRRDGAGLGLGLATVKRLVEAHGGKVAVWSTPR